MGVKLTKEQKIEKARARTIDMEMGFNELVKNVQPGIIISPIYIPVRAKTVPDKKCALNMNSYRNRQHHMSNQLKIQYKELMESQLEGKQFKTPIGITYTLYYSHKSDLMNVVSIVDKFFCDALQEYGCIPEDNVEHVTEIHSVVGGKVKNPRMEITILE